MLASEPSVAELEASGKLEPVPMLLKCVGDGKLRRCSCYDQATLEKVAVETREAATKAEAAAEAGRTGKQKGKEKGKEEGKGRRKGRRKGAQATEAEQVQLDQEAAALVAAADRAEAAAKAGRTSDGDGDHSGWKQTSNGQWELNTAGHNYECAECGSANIDLYPCTYCNLTWCSKCLPATLSEAKLVDPTEGKEGGLFCCAGCYGDAVREHKKQNSNRGPALSKRRQTARNKEQAAAVNDGLASASSLSSTAGSRRSETSQTDLEGEAKKKSKKHKTASLATSIASSSSSASSSTKAASSRSSNKVPKRKAGGGRATTKSAKQQRDGPRAQVPRTLGLTRSPHLISLTTDEIEFLVRSDRSQFGARANGHCGFEASGVQANMDVKQTRAFIQVSPGLKSPLCRGSSEPVTDNTSYHVTPTHRPPCETVLTVRCSKLSSATLVMGRRQQNSNESFKPTPRT